MSQYENDPLNYQSDNLKEQPKHNQNQGKVVFEGGTYSDKPTTETDVERNDDLEYGDHGTTTMTPTNDLPPESSNGTNDFDDDDDDDFDDTVGEDNLPDEDGFNANSDDPTEQELTKTWMGNEKTVHEAGSKGMEGEPMGGQNFGKTELEQKNSSDASDREHHSLGLGNSALQQPSEEISNPPSIESSVDNPPYKKVDD
ncbi:hypothetical protein [Mucilaginibacter arboris]|uniref:Uncharacterized protein n=1 Tax=Mucilaginibacter arboris TaxID=2682090 RepID=A0A7K1SZT1_9SPHI|nr:hypothetical protein [Mucilaginibacter arboris]MVN22767.1 hypothetical protein [Mucilaginibacter arboris]